MTFTKLSTMYLLIFASFQLSAATITIQNDDIAGVGFNNNNAPGNPAQKGNNPGSTLGEMRMNVFLEAAKAWADILNSNVEITVSAHFEEKFCDEFSATLGSAGATSSWSSFPGSDANVAYHVALAESLRDADLNGGGSVEVNATFNSKLDTNDALCMGGGGFYYGLDDNVPIGTSALFPVVLHELGHGLGFSSLSDVNPGGSGTFTGAGGHPDAYSRNLFDLAVGKSWSDMNNAERLASALSEPLLVWAGARVTTDRGMHLGAATELKINTPSNIAGIFNAMLGDEPTIILGVNGITGNVVDGNTFEDLVFEDPGDPNDDYLGPKEDPPEGCTQIAYTQVFANKVVLFDESSNCSGVIQAFFAEFEGAVGVIIVASAESGLPDVSGQIGNQEVTIPYIGVEKSVGVAIRANLVQANVTIRTNPTTFTGENQGKVKMYAPASFVEGSSVSHWSKTATPDLLMEPSLGTLIFENVDLTAAAFHDIGWSVNIPGGVLEVIYEDGFE